MRTSYLSIGVGALAAMALGYPTGADAQYYKGKTIEIIVGFASGGTDTAARITSRRLQKYIPGNPKVVVKNMPGGASLKAQNFIFERAKPDGTTIGFNPFQVMAEVTGRKGVRFKYPEFTFVAGVRGPGLIAVARKDIAAGGLNSPGDLKKINKPLTYTGRNPLHNIDIASTLAFDMLGMTHGYVPGFRGSAAITTSLEQGETNITGAGSIHWLKHLTPRMVNTGKLVPLFQMGVFQGGKLTKEKIYPANVPLFEDYYRQVTGKAPSGQMYEAYAFAGKMRSVANFLVLGPPNMNPEATKILRDAYAKSMADPETTKEATQAVLAPYGYVGNDAAKGVMDQLKKADPKLVKFFKDRTGAQSGAGKK